MPLYGLTGGFLAAPDKRDELVAHMLEAAELRLSGHECGSLTAMARPHRLRSR
jgi:hypothetical protein